MDDFTNEPGWWVWRATRTTPAPKSGSFIAWWRKLDRPCILVWDERGHLWTDSGVAINGPVEHDFSAWHYCPPKPTVDQT